jgi:hypothetical protein
MKPICVACQRFYRPKRNGVRFIEGMPKGNEAPPGTRAPEHWKPYKLWTGDLWICHGCGHEIIVGTALHPIAEQYQPDFHDKVAASEIRVQVNDC